MAAQYLYSLLKKELNTMWMVSILLKLKTVVLGQLHL